ncbi:MAG TPA: O-antigen ligase family protein, partial [Candidatus Binataceae bacterium]|nr:O-antigen ligase family protein [Candidatus Binataceae bacterium]
MRIGVRWPDRLVSGGLVIILSCMPLAFGAVHRAAFIIFESLSFALLGVWMLKIWQEAPAAPRLAIERRELGRLAMPAAAITALLGLQIVPLPPRVLRVIAPANYQLYRISFPGWPWFAPYQILSPLPDISGAGSVSPAGSRSGQAAGVATIVNSDRIEVAPTGWGKLYWRTLAIAPSVTVGGLIEWLALVAIFLVVLLFPCGLIGEREAERHFYRTIVLTTMTVAIVLAALGLCERAWWNGKLLWFYIPTDWGGPLFPNPPRASGPFVDPDHFANYLAMALPITVTLAIFPCDLVRREWQPNLRLLAGLGCIVMAPAILLSLSRAGWLAAVSGVVMALALGLRRAPALAPPILRWLGGWRVAYLIAAPLLALGLLLLFAGPVGQSAIANRLDTTLAGVKGGIYRPIVWRETLSMIGGFPLFGVGLGCWPELFPHYQRPPWIPFFFREAENDYLQFVAETGLIGALIMIWLGFTIFRRLREGALRMPELAWPRFAGLLGGMLALLVHEAFDFSLRTPANAFCFTIMLALALRMAMAEGPRRRTVELRLAARSSRYTAPGAVLTALALGGLIVADLRQDGRAYPYGVAAARNRTATVANVAEHPAMGSAHLALANTLDGEASSGPRSAALRAAVWLDPNEPAAHDSYAQSLLLAGAERAAIEQIALSVYRAPRLEAHYYLDAQSIPWLLPDEQAAITKGFERAITAGFADAADALAIFYGDLGRYRDIAELYDRIARTETVATDRLSDLLRAGRNYALVGDYPAATTALRAAMLIDRADARPYAELARSVYGPRHRLDEAQNLVATAVRAGADPYDLNLALADAAEAADDRKATASALEAALRYRSSYDTAMRLGA